jgi:hypothetical protein
MRAVRSTGAQRQVRIATSEQPQVRMAGAEVRQVRTRLSTGERIAVRHMGGPAQAPPSFEAGASGLMTLHPQEDEPSPVMGRTAILSRERGAHLDHLRRTRELQRAQAMVQAALQQAQETGDEDAQARERQKLSYLELRQRARTRGARQQALLSLGAVMAVSWAAVALGDLGQAEMALDPTEPMIYLRAGLLLAVSLGVTLGWRREKLSALGLKPRWSSTAFALPVVAALAVAASSLARFEVGADAALPALLGLVALRSLASATFFQGLLGRLLARSLPEPTAALLLTALSYAIYGTTYAALMQADALHTFYAGALYFVGLGLPLGVIYQKTRSVLVVAASEATILGACAWGGLQWAQSL